MRSFSVYVQHLQIDFINEIQFEASFGKTSTNREAAQVYGMHENLFQQIQLRAALSTLAWWR